MRSSRKGDRRGGEDLYGRLNDPNEWKNIAGEPRHTGLKRKLAQWMPKRSVPPVPGRNHYDFDFDTNTFRRKWRCGRIADPSPTYMYGMAGTCPLRRE